MLKFSANLGLLWKDLPIPIAIENAAKAGFDAIELHFPYHEDPVCVRNALVAHNMKLISINTDIGAQNGDFGICALPEREAEARSLIDQSIEYAEIAGADNIHLLAGISQGQTARNTFVRNLQYACKQLSDSAIGLLIEPLNPVDRPDYFLSCFKQAESIINQISDSKLRLMFDCYHAGMMGENVTEWLQRLLPIIGHIQIASVPDRKAPDHGHVDYQTIFDLLEYRNYQKPLGAEYVMDETDNYNFAWLKAYKAKFAAKKESSC